MKALLDVYACFSHVAHHITLDNNVRYILVLFLHKSVWTFVLKFQVFNSTYFPDHTMDLVYILYNDNVGSKLYSTIPP